MVRLREMPSRQKEGEVWSEHLHAIRDEDNFIYYRLLKDSYSSLNFVSFIYL